MGNIDIIYNIYIYYIIYIVIASLTYIWLHMIYVIKLAITKGYKYNLGDYSPAHLG